MKKLFVSLVIAIILSFNFALANEQDKTAYTLSEIIDFGLKMSPSIAATGKNVEQEKYALDSAKSEKNLQLDFTSSITKYRYSVPVVPISAPLTMSHLLELPFDSNIYNFGTAISLPLYTGGRIENTISAQEFKRLIAEDSLKLEKQELVYNLSSVFYKIMQFEKNLLFYSDAVKQTEEHKKDVEVSLKAGTVAKVELIKTDTKLAQAKHDLLLVKNSIQSAYELLKTLMGMEDKSEIFLIYEETPEYSLLPAEEAINKTFLRRPDYLAALNKVKMCENKKKVAEASAKPNVNLNAIYSDNTGGNWQFMDNWQAGVNFIVPVLDGGFAKAEIEKAKKAIEQAKEEERALRQNIIKEIKDAYIDLENARSRINILKDSIVLAEENFRIENLKFKAGKSTSTDLFDAQTDLLNARTNYYQAVFDEKIAIAALKRAMGEEYKQGIVNGKQ